MNGPQFYLTVQTSTNTWQTGGSPGPGAIVAKPTLKCNDCSVTATIFANGDGFFTIENPTSKSLDYTVTLAYAGPLGEWQSKSTVTVPPGKISVVRDVP